MENKSVLYLYTGDHPVHRKFAKEITKKEKRLTWKIPKGEDIYFSEGEFFKLVLLRKLGLISKKSKIITLFSDPRLFYLDRKIKFDVKKQTIKKTHSIKRYIFKKLLSNIDGAICVGEFEENLLKKHYKGPTQKVDIFVENKFYKDLFKMSPKLNNKKILFIANGPDSYYKGLDLLLELAKRMPNVKITLVGGHWKEFIGKNPKIPKNLQFLGKKKPSEIKKIISEHSLYLHLGRGEAFGVVIVEAMVAGIPSMVSEITGAKEAVTKIDLKFVLPLNLNKIVQNIEDYFSLSSREKKGLSKKFKNIGKKYNEKVQLKKFKIKFKDLVKEIYGKN